MVTNAAQARERYTRETAQRDLLRTRLTDAQAQAASAGVRHADAQEARALLQTVARQTQAQLEFHISALVTSALAAVFPNPYQFTARFVERRNKTECDLLLVRDGREYDPMTCTGGGVVDVVAFALRAAFWALVKRRPVIVLDEPFKFVSEGLHEACSQMIKALSTQLGVQIVMVSHLPGIIASADKVVKIDNGRVVG